MSHIFDKLDFWVLLIGVILAWRSWVRSIRKWEFYGDCDVLFPKKERQYQKSCALLIALYYTVMTFTGVWFILLGFWGVIYNTSSPNWVMTIAPLVLIALFVGYFLIRGYVIPHYKLKERQDKIVKLHKTLEFITEDNDYEIEFKRAFFKVDNQLYCAVLWVLIIMIVMWIY